MTTLTQLLCVRDLLLCYLHKLGLVTYCAFCLVRNLSLQFEGELSVTLLCLQMIEKLAVKVKRQADDSNAPQSRSLVYRRNLFHDESIRPRSQPGDSKDTGEVTLVSEMGIQGLLPMLKEIQRPIHVKEWKGKTLAVDAYVRLDRLFNGLTPAHGDMGHFGAGWEGPESWTEDASGAWRSLGARTAL